MITFLGNVSTYTVDDASRSREFPTIATHVGNGQLDFIGYFTQYTLVNRYKPYGLPCVHMHTYQLTAYLVRIGRSVPCQQKRKSF